MGAGGELSLVRGRIGWFEIAGHRDEAGALADPYSEGNIGGGFVEPFVVVFDYRRVRVAFVRKP